MFPPEQLPKSLRLQCLSVLKILPEMRGCGELTEDVYSKKTVF